VSEAANPAGSVSTVQRGSLAVPSPSAVVPLLIASIGDQASWRYIEFFMGNIRNPNTRRAYARACAAFLQWAEQRGLRLETIRPFDMAAYVEHLQKTVTAPSVKQQLAAVRMLFDWLVVGQVMPANPASSVRGPKHVVKTGKTPVLDGAEWRLLMTSIPAETVKDLRDRALIAVLTYSFARIGAALALRVEDLRPQGGQNRRNALNLTVTGRTGNGRNNFSKRAWAFGVSRGHSVGCHADNAKGERARNGDHAAILSRPRLSGRRCPAVAAARSHRKSPEKPMCSQVSGDVWASRASRMGLPWSRRCCTASAR
jgi:hypothetical protein